MSDQTLCLNSSTLPEWRSREISNPPMPRGLLRFNPWPQDSYGRIEQCGYVEMDTKLVNQGMGAPIQVAYNPPDKMRNSLIPIFVFMSRPWIDESPCVYSLANS